MVALLPSFRVLAVFCTLAFAAPASHLASRDAHPHTHHVRTLPNGLEMRSFHTPSNFELFHRGIDHPLSKRAGSSLRDSGMSFISERLGEEAKWRHTLSRNDSTSNIYAYQEINGIPVATTVANVAINKLGKVSAWSSNFVTPKTAPSTKPKIDADAAVTKATSSLTGTSTGTDPTLKYYPLEDGTLALTFATDLKLDGNSHTVRAFVHAETGDVVGMIDYTSNLSFRVSPITSQDPSKDFELLKDPEDLKSSPGGWTKLNGAETNSTSGNNAVAFIGSPKTGIGAQSSPGVFDFKLNLNQLPTVGVNQNAALTNAFFVVNTAHDIFYQYGFTEDAFNFQQSNNGLGGVEGDRVQISVQDDSGTDNAQFTTQADGRPGVMQMFLFVSTDPEKDGAVTNDVVAHEFTHGVSSRLTGGGTADCLQSLESGGLGEGWSDAFADWLTQQSGQVVDFAVGNFLFPGGIRTAPYSLDRNVNKLLFSDVAALNEVHQLGEVWAQTLHVANAALIEANGFDKDAFTNPNGNGGNTAWLHLFVDALALQPCNPTFLDARAAWIQADVDRFDGKNACTLWTAFSSMGLGPDAAPGQDDFSVPASCGGTGGEVASTGTGTSTGAPTGPTTGTGNGNGKGNGGRGRGGRRGGRRNQGFVAHGHKH